MLYHPGTAGILHQVLRDLHAPHDQHPHARLRWVPCPLCGTAGCGLVVLLGWTRGVRRPARPRAAASDTQNAAAGAAGPHGMHLSHKACRQMTGAAASTPPRVRITTHHHPPPPACNTAPPLISSHPTLTRRQGAAAAAGKSAGVCEPGGAGGGQGAVWVSVAGLALVLCRC